MPRASELTKLQTLKIFVYGNAGAGKTFMIRTLPGKKFVFVFDPAGLATYRSTDDIEFETFIPTEVPMGIATIKGNTDSEVSYLGSDVYRRYESYYHDNRERIERDFDWVCVDSITSLQALMMDEIARLYGREGKTSDLGDFNITGDSLMKNLRNFTGLNTNCFVIGHEKATQDKLLRTIDIGIMVPGQYGKKLPLLFSDIYHIKAIREGEEMKYLADTAPAEDYPLARCSLELEPTIDVTVKRREKDPTLGGLGRLLRNSDRFDFNFKQEKEEE